VLVFGYQFVMPRLFRPAEFAMTLQAQLEHWTPHPTNDA